MKIQLVTSYRVSHLQRYGVTVRGNVTSVYPPLRDSTHAAQVNYILLSKEQYLVGANRKTSGQSTRQVRLISGKTNMLFLYRVFINHKSPSEAYRIVQATCSTFIRSTRLFTAIF